MGSELKLFDYQQKAFDFLVHCDESRALFLDMGLGKTAVVLKALQYLMTDTCAYARALIVAPKRVAEYTWPEEIAKWSCFDGMRYSLIAGDVGSRVKALRVDASVYIIGRDNLEWLSRQFKVWPFTLVVLDELSSFKNRESKRFQIMRRVRPFIKRVIGMTGTPAPNGLVDLWSQIWLLDKGKRLEPRVTAFRSKYFERKPLSYFSEWELKKGADKEIANAVSDICLSMRKEDYLQLPPIIYQERCIEMPDAVASKYKAFKRDMVYRYSDGDKTISAVNAAVLTMKLLEFCGGAIYDEGKAPVPVHDLKLDALDQIIEEANGQNVMIYYAFTFERDMILKRYPQAVDIREVDAIARWQSGSLPILVAHPASAGHGLNLQSGGHIAVWYNLVHPLELYQQANMRLYRIGQDKAVTVFAITIKGAIDSKVYNIVLSGKAELQDALIDDLRGL